MSNFSGSIDYIRDERDDFQTYLAKALQYGFRCIFARTKDEFDYAMSHKKQSPLIIAGAIDFPDGVMNLSEKLETFERYALIGYTEIDYVLHQHNVETCNLEAIEEEMKQVHQFCIAHNIKEKVIVEFCKLDGREDMKIAICEIANRVHPAFLKTSTGKSFKGADLNDVKLMKEYLCNDIKIKASGGIKTYEQATCFFEAGVSVIGASSAIEIVQGKKVNR